MSKSISNRFDRIVNDNLPKKLEMLEVLMENPFQADVFSRSGVGIMSVMKEIGRVTDFKGVYVFIQNNKPIYIDESSYVVKRLLRHFKGSTKYQKKLASTIADLKSKNRSTFTLNDALAEMREMHIVFMDVPDDLERKITTLYFQSQYDCIYNMFEWFKLKAPENLRLTGAFVPEAGIEPALLAEHEFESCASTSSAT